MIFKSGYKIKLTQAVSVAATTTIIIIIRESSLYELTQRIIQIVCPVKRIQLDSLRIIYQSRARLQQTRSIPVVVEHRRNLTMIVGCRKS